MSPRDWRFNRREEHRGCEAEHSRDELEPRDGQSALSILDAPVVRGIHVRLVVWIRERHATRDFVLGDSELRATRGEQSPDVLARRVSRFHPSYQA